MDILFAVCSSGSILYIKYLHNREPNAVLKSLTYDRSKKSKGGITVDN